VSTEQDQNLTAIMDGDHPGHPFRGNQHVSAEEHSTVAGRASRAAKAAERAGNPKALKKAHKTAFHAHMAALADAKGTTRKYHKAMAKFHAQQGGVLDSAAQVDDDEAEDDSDALAESKGKGPVPDGKGEAGDEGKGEGKDGGREGPGADGGAAHEAGETPADEAAEGEEGEGGEAKSKDAPKDEPKAKPIEDDGDGDPLTQKGKGPLPDKDDGEAMDSATLMEVLDGDFPGHPFRGNQHVKAAGASRRAGSMSRRAHKVNGKGGDKAQHRAHQLAADAHHKAAGSAKGKTAKFHKTMARFHASRAKWHGDRLGGKAMDSAAGMPEWPAEVAAFLDRADPITVNVFQAGDRVVSSADGNDYVVVRQHGYQVTVKGRHQPIHANHLKLASGAKPERKVLDAVDHGWHSRTIAKFRDYSEAQLRFVIKDATEAADIGEKMGNPKAGQYRDEVHYASMELQRRKKGGKQGDPYDERKGPMAPTKGGALDSAAELPGLRAALRAKGGANFMDRLVIMRNIIGARELPGTNVSIPEDMQATPDAMELIALALSSGSADNAGATAIELHKGLRQHAGAFASIAWSTADPATVPAMDSADLFGSQTAGHYLAGLCTAKGKPFGTVYVHADGSAMFRPGRVGDGSDEYWGQDGLRDNDEEDGGEDWQAFIGWRGDIAAMAKDIADLADVVLTTTEPSADDRHRAINEALQAEGWTIGRGDVAELDDEDEGVLIQIEAEYTGPQDPIAFMILKTNERGDRTTAQMVEDRDMAPADVANLLIMEANALELARRLSAAEANAIAKTIIQQLGGSKFTTMTGAKNFVSLSDGNGGVQFTLPTGFSQKDGKSTGINKVIIRLNASDTYDVEFGAARMSRAKGPTYKVIAKADDIYADSLQEVFTRYTGLDTSLGSMGRRNEPTREEVLAQQQADRAKREREATAEALARLGELGWAKSKYADIKPTSMMRAIVGVGKQGGMVVPDGSRNFYAEVTDSGELIAKLGDDILAREAVIGGAAAADKVNAAVEAHANEGRAKNGLPPIGSAELAAPAKVLESFPAGNGTVWRVIESSGYHIASLYDEGAGEVVPDTARRWEVGGQSLAVATEYARSMAAKALAADTAPPAADPKAELLAMLRQVADGTHPRITETAFIDEILAIFEGNQDPDVQALLDPAANAISAAMLKATEHLR